jgi:hypothetical protein
VPAFITITIGHRQECLCHTSQLSVPASHEENRRYRRALLIEKKIPVQISHIVWLKTTMQGAGYTQRNGCNSAKSRKYRETTLAYHVLL